MTTLEIPQPTETLLTPTTLDGMFLNFSEQTTKQLLNMGLTEEELLPIETILPHPLSAATEGLVESGSSPYFEHDLDQVRQALLLKEGETPADSYRRLLPFAIANHSREIRPEMKKSPDLDDKNWSDTGGPIPAPFGDVLREKLANLDLSQLTSVSVDVGAYNQAATEMLNAQLRSNATRIKLGTFATRN